MPYIYLFEKSLFFLIYMKLREKSMKFWVKLYVYLNSVFMTLFVAFVAL